MNPSLGQLLDSHSQLKGPHFLNDRERKASLEKVRSWGLPHKKLEDWRYTDTTSFFNDPFQMPHQLPISEKDLPLHEYQDCRYLYVFMSGELQKQFSRLHPDIDIKTLNNDQLQFQDHPQDSLYHLMMATSTQGVQLTIPSGKQLNDPIYILHLAPKKQKTFLSQIVSVHLEKNAQAQFIEIHHLEEQSHLRTHLTGLHLAQGSHLAHTVLTCGFRREFAQLYTRANIEKDALLKSWQFHLGGKLCRNDLSIHLRAPGAQTQSYGLYALGSGMQSDHYTKIRHLAAHTYSEQLYKGIIDSEGRAVFKGTIKVDPQAQQITSSQQNKNLLLAKSAHVDSMPQLEILADDVKCAHGSTIGQLDPDQEFYLLSRGFTLSNARQLLAQAFAQDILFKLDEKVQRKISPFIQRQLQSLHLGEL